LTTALSYNILHTGFDISVAFIARSARNAPAVTSSTGPAACIRALRVTTVIHKKIVNVTQNKDKNTQIFRSNPTTGSIARRTNMRQHVLLIKKEITKHKIRNKDVDAGATSPEHKVAALTEYHENMDISEVTSEGGHSLLGNNNSELLNEVSFDDLIEGHIQSSAPSQLAKWQVLMDTVKQGGRVATRPKYFGDTLGIRCKRPNYSWVKFDSSKPVHPSKIPRLAKLKVESEG
jgi:hypothetical protein